MKILVIGEGGGLGRRLVTRAAAASMEVRFAGDGPAAEMPIEGVENLRTYPARAFDIENDPAETLVVLPQDASSSWRHDLASAAAAAISSGRAWKRVVYWGPHRVYAASATPPYDAWSEAAALVQGGRWAPWADVDRTLAAAPIAEKYIFRTVPVVGAAGGGWLGDVRGLPLVPTGRAEVPVQLLHEDDALAILWRAVTGGLTGTFNASGDGLLLVRQLARCAGRLAVPLPRWLAAAVLAPGRVVGRPASLRGVLEGTYAGVVVDNARLKTHFGYRPRRSSKETLAVALGQVVSGSEPAQVTR